MANHEHVGPFLKPTAMDRRLAKFAKRVARDRAKRTLQAGELRVWLDLKLRIYTRDKGHCRICGKPVELRSDNPEAESDCHHIIFRSAGGDNDSTNLLTVCAWPCHQRIHRKLSPWLEVDGNGDGVVDIQSIDPETGRVIEAWQSEVPR